MRTKITLLSLLIFTLILLGLNSGGVVDKTQIFAAAPTPAPEPDLFADVQDITIEKERVYTWCPWNRYACTKNELNIKVTTIAKEADKNNLTYYYVVSGGQIIGQGANVIWDLSTVPQGKHTITAGVGSGYVIRGKTVTKSVEIRECEECHPFCTCPTLSILAPTKPVKAGDSFIISAKVQGSDEKERITYQWTISAGTIIEGQKASQLLIKTTPDMSGKIEATVEIGGTDPACNCPTKVTETVSIK